MKRLISLAVCFIFLLCTSAFGAGTITEQPAYKDNANNMHTRIIAWTGDSGDGGVPDLVMPKIDGYIMSVTTVPGIQGLFLLANALRNTMNAHAADDAEHLHGGSATPDTTNFPVPRPSNWGAFNSSRYADATDVGTLYRLIGAMLTAYTAHDVDAAKSTPVFHNADVGGGTPPTSSETPDTLAEAVTRLNDLSTKYSDTHDTDSTGHTVGTQHAESTTDSGADTPTTLYDITLLDANGMDAAEGELADRSATVLEEYIFSSMPRYVRGNIVIDIDNNSATSATGLLIIRVYRGK